MKQDEFGNRVGFNESGAWRTFSHPDQSIPAKDQSIAIAGGNGTGKPQFTSDYISLNGAGSQSYETFYLERAPQIQPGETEAFNFCKTEYRPYDAVVVSILAAARTIAPDKIEVSSDGGDAAIKYVF